MRVVQDPAVNVVHRSGGHVLFDHEPVCARLVFVFGAAKSEINIRKGDGFLCAVFKRSTADDRRAQLQGRNLACRSLGRNAVSRYLGHRKPEPTVLQVSVDEGFVYFERHAVAGLIPVRKQDLVRGLRIVDCYVIFRGHPLISGGNVHLGHRIAYALRQTGNGRFLAREQLQPERLKPALRTCERHGQLTGRFLVPAHFLLRFGQKRDFGGPVDRETRTSETVQGIV